MNEWVRYYVAPATTGQNPVERRESHGIRETGPSIANKLARGTFAARFFLAALPVLEAGGWGWRVYEVPIPLQGSSH
jgi:hypothetical protein